MSRQKTPKPPGHLATATKRWFRHVVDHYELDQHHVRVLEQCCSAWDRAEEARLALAKEGLTYLDRFGSPRARPEVAIERDSRIAFVRCLRELDLDGSGPAEESRPPVLRSIERAISAKKAG